MIRQNNIEGVTKEEIPNQDMKKRKTKEKWDAFLFNYKYFLSYLLPQLEYKKVYTKFDS